MADDKTEPTSQDSSHEGLKVRKKQDAEAVEAVADSPAEVSASAEGRPGTRARVVYAEGFEPPRTTTTTEEASEPRSSNDRRRDAESVAREAVPEAASATTTDFEAMFMEQADRVPSRRFFETGERVEGRITKITDRFILVDLGVRSEGVASREQFLTDEGELEVSEGETREFFVLRSGCDGVVLGKQLDARQASAALLEQALDSGLPVQGRVTGKNKGGFEVELLGATAFCPFSQIDLRNAEEPDVYLNETFRFKVTEVREGGRRIVVSRAALLREEQERQRKELLDSIEEGQVRDGVVSNVREFGAFVDLGGVDGLVHISELSWDTVEKAEDVVRPGDAVTVRVLGIEERPKGLRISLSMKQAMGDPWETVQEQFHVGQNVRGTVTRTAPFGAFVQIARGVEGLVHISELSWDHVRRAEDVVSQGQTISVQIQDIDLLRRRISLSAKLAQGDPWQDVADRFAVGAEARGTIEKVEDFGVFVALGDGITALLPRSEMELGRNETPHSKARAGEEIVARVLSVDLEQRRMALTWRDGDVSLDTPPPRRASQRDHRNTSRDDRQDRGQQGPRSYQDEGAASGFGTLGDLINFNRKNK